jgi:AbiV family abortive infection protein
VNSLEASLIGLLLLLAVGRHLPEARDLTYRKVAFECFSNAKSLHDEACLLADEGHRPRAAALAILGLEEFSKAIAYSLAALLPGKEHILADRDQLRKHEVKHLVTAAAEAAEIETHEYRLVVSQEAGFPLTERERLGILFDWLVKHDVACVVADSEGAKRFFRELRKDLTDFLPEPDVKNAALYVDIGPGGEVLTPSRIEERAASAILGLEWFLDVYAALPDVLEDNAAWGDFVRRVHKP